MYDRVYSHLISSSPHRETILRVLGQIIIAKDMSPHMDVIQFPANTAHSDRIAMILGLERGAVLRAIANVRMTPEVGHADIKIRNPTFQDFLLDRSRSKDLFVDLNDARLTLQLAAPIRKVFGAQGTCTILPMYSLWNDAHALHPFSFLQRLPWSKYALEQQFIDTAAGYV